MRAERGALVLFARFALAGCAEDGEPAEDAALGEVVVDSGALSDAELAEASISPDGSVPFVPPAVPLSLLEGGEVRLNVFGLYRDLASKELAPDLVAFEPAYPLWSDAADKRRWLRLPEGQRIDNSSADHWKFPVGSVLFKEFSRAGKRLETRVIFRFGPLPDETWMGAFAWSEDESDAVLVRDGASDARGTTHDIPSQKNCGTCHNGEPGRVLGVSAIQLPAFPEERLTQASARYRVPGDAATQQALGYLHANCGSCHNPSGSARPDTDMVLRLSVSDLEGTNNSITRSVVGVKMQYFADARPRVAAGEPEQSGVYFRMSQRGPRTQMPPFASEQVDTHGSELVRAWIATLR